MDYTQKLPQEDEHIEYKESSNTFPKEAWKSISAFENTDGGVLILGIEELDNHNFKISGVKDPQKILDDFFSNKNNPMKLSYSTIENEDIQELEIKGKKIIEISIKQAPDNKKPVYLGNNTNEVFIREKSTDVKAKGESMKTLLRLSDDNLDTKVLNNYDLDDLDLDSVEKYKSELVKRDSYSNYSELDTESFLKRIGVISKNYETDGNYGITVGGLLFFGKNNAILHTFPNFQLDYFDKSHPEQDRWTSRISSIESNLNIYTFFILVEEHFKNSIPNSFKLDKFGKRIDTFGSMFTAIREGLINMLMHADYYEGTSITLNDNVNYYEFLNPGKMKIPPEEFFTTNNSKNRNAIISKLFLQVGFGERAGHGGEKIYESSVQNNYRSPEIKTNINQTRLIIWKVDFEDSFSGKEINERERLVLKAIISSPSSAISHKNIEIITGYSRYVADGAISSLLDKKIIEKIGSGRSTKFSTLSTDEQVIAQAQIIPDMLRNSLNRLKK